MNNFDRYFGKEETGRSGSSEAVGKIGLWILHLVMGTFAIYSGAHGVNASLQYAGGSEFSRIAQIVGIVTIEAVLIGIYLAFLNGKVTGPAQGIAAGVTFALGFGLALMGIIADSQVNSGLALSPIVGTYLKWGLPIAPGFMSLGALLVHALDPKTLQFRREDEQRRELEEVEFSARLAIEKARAEEELSKRGLQILSRKAVFQELETIYQSAEFRDAIKRTAIDRAPELFSEAGILIDRVRSSGDTAPPSLPEAALRASKEADRAPSLNGSANGHGSSFLR